MRASFDRQIHGPQPLARNTTNERPPDTAGSRSLWRSNAEYLARKLPFRATWLREHTPGTAPDATLQYCRVDGSIRDDNRSRMSVEVMPLPPLRRGNLVGGLAVTDSNGNYAFTGLPAGQYRVGVNLSHGPRERRPYPATFYPGTQDWRHAAVVTLGPTQILTGIDFRLADRLADYEIRGRIL